MGSGWPFWASSSPQGHLLGHLGGPDIDFIDFGCVLRSSWESLWGPFGHKFVILDAQSACRILKLFFMAFIRKNDLHWEACMFRKQTKYIGFP